MPSFSDYPLLPSLKASLVEQELTTPTDIQARAILDMRLARLSGLEIEKLEAEYKDVIEEIQSLKARVDELRVEADRATRTGELNRAAEVNYGEIPQAEAAIGAATARLEELQKEHRYLKEEEVEPDDIAAVVAEWTGIPVTRLMESERQRLTQLEEHLGERVVGQAEAIEAEEAREVNEATGAEAALALY